MEAIAAAAAVVCGAPNSTAASAEAEAQLQVDRRAIGEVAALHVQVSARALSLPRPATGEQIRGYANPQLLIPRQRLVLLMAPFFARSERIYFFARLR